MAKRPRNRVQPTLHRIALGEQPWPKGHAIAFNLGQKATQSRSTFNLQPSTFNQFAICYFLW
ncbi:hypothetical protein [Moorena sp. SIO4A5]|uniref:hypothetical protein n=1 Tax=Moorena sp. SIO4A5 TaxID=2607838 RepID=UPI0013CCE12A|nr:hypothetical protein [Moorena sp. SIO4A5]NEO20799.1 hypothetical protein [Moorena sp. SIO4A5]